MALNFRQYIEEFALYAAKFNRWRRQSLQKCIFAISSNIFKHNFFIKKRFSFDQKSRRLSWNSEELSDMEMNKKQIFFFLLFMKLFVHWHNIHHSVGAGKKTGASVESLHKIPFYKCELSPFIIIIIYLDLKCIICK